MRHKFGVVVGRFQPFHKGHLDYVLKALNRCEKLFIGITTPGSKPTPNEPDNPDRFGKKNNPFSYLQRKKMIEKSLIDEEVNLARIGFVHFRPEKLDEWFKVVPKGAVYFLLLLSNSEKQKVNQMELQGLRVEVLEIKSQGDYKAFDIREKIAHNKSWEHLVPKAVKKYINQKELINRVK